MILTELLFFLPTHFEDKTIVISGFFRFICSSYFPSYDYTFIYFRNESPIPRPKPISLNDSVLLFEENDFSLVVS